MTTDDFGHKWEMRDRYIRGTEDWHSHTDSSTEFYCERTGTEFLMGLEKYCEDSGNMGTGVNTWWRSKIWDLTLETSMKDIHRNNIRWSTYMTTGTRSGSSRADIGAVTIFWWIINNQPLPLTQTLYMIYLIPQLFKFRRMGFTQWVCLLCAPLDGGDPLYLL